MVRIYEDADGVQDRLEEALRAWHEARDTSEALTPVVAALRGVVAAMRAALDVASCEETLAELGADLERYDARARAAQGEAARLERLVRELQQRLGVQVDDQRRRREDERPLRFPRRAA